MSLLFSPWVLGAPGHGLNLANRLVVAPMCQYAADHGQATDWHLFHWANLLNSGAGLVVLEATAVVPEGRISPGCLGLWDDATEAAFTQHLQRARALAPPVPVCLQLAHAGRKASSALPWHGGALLNPAQGGWPTVAPSAVPHLPDETPPHALGEAELTQLTHAFAQAAHRARRAGVDALELHAAHGYLLHQFLSPLANRRGDAWGGDFAGRTRWPNQVFAAVRQAFDGPVGVRVSATDWVPGGWTVEDTARWATDLKAAGADFVHVSSGGLSPQQATPLGPGYQLPLARQVRQTAGCTTVAVGLITQAEQAEAVLQQGDADLVALARAFLYNPRWGWHAAAQLGATVQAHPRYWRCPPTGTGLRFADARVGAR